MKRWFFTFGGGRPYAFQYVEIEAETLEEAREVMFSAHGDMWSHGYDEFKFKGQPEQYGLTCLAVIKANPSNGYYRSTHPESRIPYKDEPALCDDEGCPQHGTPHVCVEKSEAHKIIQAFVDQEVEYMMKNTLGDPEEQHMVKWAREWLAKEENNGR